MKESERRILILAGPTAVGKSSLAIALAKEFNAEIISADSRQVYRYMDIGTAKVPHAERRGIEHHLIDILEPDQSYSVVQYCRDAAKAIEHIKKKEKQIIVCGGTGFYLHSLMHGLDDIPDVPKHITVQIEKDLAEGGIEALQRELAEVDPDYFHNIDPANRHRLIRAIAVSRHSGRPFSSFHLGSKSSLPYDFVPVMLTMDRTRLYERINMRVDSMIDAGLEDEVKKLRQYWSQQSLQTVGYQELIKCFQGHYDRNEAIRLIKRNTRRYAKRQFTWFNNRGSWMKCDVTSPDTVWNTVAEIWKK